MDAVAAGCDLIVNMMRSRRNVYGFREEQVTSDNRVNCMSNMNYMSDVRSDMEENCYLTTNETYLLDTLPDDKANDKTIHSGHFMVSHVHEDQQGVTLVKDDVTDDESDSELVNCQSPNASSSSIATTAAAAVGVSQCEDAPTDDDGTSTALTIDKTLTKLFECMTLAYRSD